MADRQERRRFTASEVLRFLEEDSSSSCDSSEDFLEADVVSCAESNSSSDSESTLSDIANFHGEYEPGVWHQLSSDRRFQKIVFSVSNCGSQVNADISNELDFFQLFFEDELFAEIATNTNSYAAQRISCMRIRKSSIWRRWKPVSVQEMKAYFGTIMNMAMHDFPTIFSYFSKKWEHFMPFFTSVFSRSRFLQIHWMLHVASTAADQVGRRDDKIKNIISYIQRKCLEYYIPDRDVVIDETTIGFKGRFTCKMYNRQKPVKWGLRVYVLADCKTGYVSVFEPYFGIETTQTLVRPDLPFTSRVALHLIDGLLQNVQGTGYHLFTDRLYTSYQLSLELLQKGVHLTGAVNSCRKGLPPEVKNAKLNKHEIKAYTIDNKVMVLLWQDKRPVLMLSTFHDDTSTCQIRRRGGSIVEKPTVIAAYNLGKGGVDHHNQMSASYNFNRKSLKWWRKMFFWLTEVATVNSFILFNMNRKKHNLPPISHLQFRENLLKQLVGNVRNKTQHRGRPSSSDKIERLNHVNHHFMGKAEEGKRRDCAVCSDRKTPGQRRLTIFFCETCSRQPALHPYPCFGIYHSQENYRDYLGAVHGADTCQ